MKQLDLWFAIPDRVSHHRVQNRLLEILSPEEKERHLGFIRESDRQLYLLSHLMLRIALSHGTTRPAQDWVFEQEPGGKPRIAEPTPGTPDFSLSHTAGMAVCALSKDGPVGVDVEGIVRGGDVLEIASSRFTDGERRHLEGLPRPEREETAVWMWTAKEATLKATGQGLEAPLSSVIVTGFPRETPKFMSGGEGPWTLIPFRLGDSFLGTITVGSDRARASHVRIHTLEHEFDQPRPVVATTDDDILHIPCSGSSS